MLNSYSNVALLGYVPIHYATRAIGDVQADIAKYASWGSSNSSLAMQGIFLDETPNTGSDSNVAYLTSVRQTVKSAASLGAATLGKLHCNSSLTLSAQSSTNEMN
jgi:Spherulation-specific family 4